MFSKIKAWRRAIAKPKKAPPMDKTDDTIKVIMSVISLTGADPRKVVERLQERINEIEFGPKKDDDIDAIVNGDMNERRY